MGAPPFQTFFAEHRDAVWRFLVATVGRADADDCFQETWLAALRAYPPAETGNLRGWVFTIAHRKAIDEHRARARRAIPGDVPERAAGEPGTPEPALWEDVRRLPPKQRAAVVHRYVADLDYADIGAAMGTSAEAARRNVHEGITRLRKTWQTST